MNAIILQNKNNKSLYVSEFHNNAIILDGINGAKNFTRQEVKNLFATNEQIRDRYKVMVVKDNEV